MRLFAFSFLIGILTLNMNSCYAPGGARPVQRPMGGGPGGVGGGTSAGSGNYNVVSGIEYANVGGKSLKLDLYQPKGSTGATPLIVFIHGGAFIQGDRAQGSRLASIFTDHGIAVASVDYRLAPSTPLPGQIHDVKGAIRFLRANSAKYNIDNAHIGTFGISAGGLLASLVGVTCNEPELEGTIGGNQNQSSCVQAVINGFGSLPYYAMSKSGVPSERAANYEKIFGAKVGSPEFNAKLKLMAPENHIDKNDPPFLIIHGNKDTTVPIENSVEMNRMLAAAGVQTELITDAAYGHDARMILAHASQIGKFINQNLK